MITYDLQGGTEPFPLNPTGYNIETPTFTLNNPKKQDYDFLGWTGSNGTTPSNPTSVLQGTEGDLHFIANWKIHEYKINYDLGGGSVTGGNPTKYTVLDKVKIKNPTKKGYIFKGWKGTDITGKSTKVVIPRGSRGVRKYTAVWEPTMKKLPYLKTTKYINKGSKFRFIVYGENKGVKHVWKNSNDKVISINKKGVATAKKNGTTTIAYKLYDKKGNMIYGFQAKVAVITTQYQTLNTSKKIHVWRPTFMFDKTLKVGSKFKLGFTNLAKDAKVTYSSSDKNILTVDKHGIAKSKKDGFAYVTINLRQDGYTFNYRVHFKCQSNLDF